MSDLPATSAFEVLASNRWLIVGQDDEGYGVWSVADERDEPLRRFPSTDEGSEGAFDAFRSMSRARRGGPLSFTLFALAVISGAVWVFTNGYLAIGAAVDDFSSSIGDQAVYRWLLQISQTAYPVFLVSSGTFVMLWLMRHDSR